MTGTSDELKAAAAKLRNLATTAATTVNGKPTARWHFKQHKGAHSGYLYAENPTGPGIRITPNNPDGPGMRTRHGEYAAAMDPTVGTLLADWLDSAAEDADQIGPDPHALAVARAINTGGQP